MAYTKFLDCRTKGKNKTYTKEELITLFHEMINRGDLFWISSSTDSLFLYKELGITKTNIENSGDEARIYHISDTLQTVELFTYHSDQNILYKNKGLYNGVNYFEIITTSNNGDDYEYGYTFLHAGGNNYTLIDVNVS